MRRSLDIAVTHVRPVNSPAKRLRSKARYLAAFCLGFAACLLLTPEVPGKYARVEVQNVPIERLIANLEMAVKKNPKDVQALVNLARTHGMAYALKTDTAQVSKGREERGPWFGYEPKVVPFSTVMMTTDAAKQKAAKVHLAKAVEHFREAVKLASCSSSCCST
jgi:hypothetical protein